MVRTTYVATYVYIIVNFKAEVSIEFIIQTPWAVASKQSKSAAKGLRVINYVDPSVLKFNIIFRSEHEKGQNVQEITPDSLINCSAWISLCTYIAIKSIPAEDAETVMDRQSSGTPYEPTSIEEDDTGISPVYQPEVFLAAKKVHIKFLKIVAQLKQMLKDCDPKCLLTTCNKLTANASHLEAIPLLGADYLEDLDDADIEEIFNRLAFLWTWNNHSILRALLETCDCQNGLKMLDDFKSQIDTDQPLELFPIPPPSMKMAPSLSSAFTVLSIRGEYDRDEPVPLQYIHDVATIITEKFGISSHALQLLAA